MIPSNPFRFKCLLLTINVLLCLSWRDLISLNRLHTHISISSMYQSEQKLRIGWLCKKNTLGFHFLLLQIFYIISELSKNLLKNLCQDRWIYLARAITSCRKFICMPIKAGGMRPVYSIMWYLTNKQKEQSQNLEKWQNLITRFHDFKEIHWP